MRDLSKPLAPSILDKEERKKRKAHRKFKRLNNKITREHNRHARKTEGTRLAQAIRRRKNKNQNY